MPASGPQQLTPLQNAIYLLKQSQAKLAEYERARCEPIAIIGIGCRFPGADHPTAYWRMLCDGVNAIREVPADRWDMDEFYDPDPLVPLKLNTRWGGFLDKVDEFDADFFGISPREAIRVDPQHRLLLEVGWEALESAGIPPAEIAESQTGVYVGVIGNDYALRQLSEMADMDVFSGTGCSHAILANRLSYSLNLRAGHGLFLVAGHDPLGLSKSATRRNESGVSRRSQPDPRPRDDDDVDQVAHDVARRSM